jgi:DcmR-like sensory protein/helix-turn-helix protein
MSDLYSTEAAARLLGVSEASIRRWSDSGLLPVQRAGRRRTRRFAEADLRRLQARLTAAAADNAARAAPTTTPHIGLHDHWATFYDSDAGRLRMSLQFLRDGLVAGQRCFLVASKSLADEYFQALSDEHVVDPAAAVQSGQLVTRTGTGSSAREAIASWQEVWRQALGAGAGAIRMVGEMASYVGFATAQEMLDYEVAYDSLCKRFPVMTLCQYDVREFDGKTMFGALQAHPDLFGRRIADFLF